MPIPKKRKKLDTFVEPIQNQNFEIGNKQPNDLKTSLTTETANHVEKTIENAFDVMEFIDIKLRSEEDINSIKNTKTRETTGIHFSLQLDPFNLEEFLHPEQKKPNPEQKNIVDINLTFPYIWNLPIFYDITKNVIQSMKQFKIL
ncbi:MAG: hypothetical protein KDK90_10220 [Leptospiraceae bacterium]|nr:hypothetical protein [Leptospiraceae bacterium]